MFEMSEEEFNYCEEMELKQKEVRIAELEEENAELKERNAKLKGMYAYSAREAGTYKQFFEQKERENAELKTRIGISVECDKARKNGELCLGYGGDEDEPCEQCKNCVKCECGYYQLGETEKDEQLAELEKENAELKEQLEIEQNARGDWFGKAVTKDRRLNEAKEIIRDFLSVAVDYIDKEDKNYPFIVEAEQFLRVNI